MAGNNGSLVAGTKIKMATGGAVTIRNFIGDGGQGEVYKVNYNGHDYALKWYKKSYLKSMSNVQGFYNNLEQNILNGAPTNAFLWPKGITEKENDSFGYIMDIRPDNYIELCNFFQPAKNKPQVHFRSFLSVINAAIQIIEGFKTLHNNGYSYQDINDGNFFIDPNTGNVLICDNDNVSPFGTNFGIMGKQRWMAPEIVTRKNDPDKNSDLFSLSVVLFRLLYINHPLEGRYSSPPCMTKAFERKYYGEAPIFILDPDNKINRPIPGTDTNLRLFGGVYPKYLNNMFKRAFSQEVMLKKASRILEIEWLDAFFRAKAELGKCPYCRSELFYQESNESKCPDCGRTLPAVQFYLKLGNIEYPLFSGMKLYQWNVSTYLNDTIGLTAEVVTNPKHPGMIGIKNISKSNWKVKVVGGSERTINPGVSFPLSENITIDFVGKIGKIVK